MRILADVDLAAVLAVVGIDGSGAAQEPEGLAPSTIRPDLVARLPDGRLVHVEFVKDATADLDLRMLDYRLRLLRKNPRAVVDQYVLALRELDLPSSYTDPAGELRSSWSVVRLCDLNPATLLVTPASAALATLADGTIEERMHVLVAAADVISAHAPPEGRDLLLSAAATLASIVLPRPIIKAALEEAAMPVPVRDTPLGRELYDEGRLEGIREGERQAVLRVTVALLEQRFGTDERIPGIAEALLPLADEERARRIVRAASLEQLR
jgi:hypothetical protein